MANESAQSKWAVVRVAVNVLLAVATAAGTFYYAILKDGDHTRQAIWIGVIGMFCLAALNFTIFASVEFGLTGAKVAMKEATKEAYATIEHLREVASSVAKISLELLAREGRLGTISDVTRLELKHELQRTLVAIGLSSEQIAASTKGFRDFFAYLHIARVVQVTFEGLEYPEDNKPIIGFKSYQGAIDEYVNLLTEFRTPAKELRAKLGARTEITPEMEEALLDYDHFMSAGTFRRPEIWTT